MANTLQNVKKKPSNTCRYADTSKAFKQHLTLYNIEPLRHHFSQTAPIIIVIFIVIVIITIIIIVKPKCLSLEDEILHGPAMRHSRCRVIQLTENGSLTHLNTMSL